MPELTIHAGICGFTTVIRTSSADMQTVSLSYETTCPHAAKAREELTSIDAYAELKKPHESERCDDEIHADLRPIIRAGALRSMESKGVEVITV